MLLFFSILPFAAVIILLFVFKQTSIRAGFAGLVIAIMITASPTPFHLKFTQILTAGVKGLLISSIVSYVLLFGIILFYLMTELGLIKVIADYIANTTSDSVRQALLLVVSFSPLVESVSGFGIAIIVICPLLIQLGFSRFKAAVLSLAGLSAVPWGALATGTMVGAELIDLPLRSLGIGSALLAIPTFFYFTFVIVFISGGWLGVKRRLLESIIVTSILSGMVLFANTFISVELAGAIGAMTAVLAELLILKFFLQDDDQKKSKTASNHLLVFKSIFPYLFLIIFLAIIRLIPFMEEMVTSYLVLDLPTYSFRLAFLHSPGFSLGLTCFLLILIYKPSGRLLKKVSILSLKQWGPVTLSSILFISLAGIISSAGMDRYLAATMTDWFGNGTMIFSPFIGALGGFLTGSNTGANAMFMKLQLEMANMSGLPGELFAFGQNTAASHLTMASPSRVLLGVSVAGIKNEEGKVFKQIFVISILTVPIIAFNMFLLVK